VTGVEGVHCDRSVLFVYMTVHCDRSVLFVHMTVHCDRSVLFVHMTAAGSIFQTDGRSALQKKTAFYCIHKFPSLVSIIINLSPLDTYTIII
jgi:hypothetical protein